jgi:flagellar basal-body rod protein FlgB
MSRTLFPPTLEVLQKNLDLRLARHQVLTSNIANAETPGYIAKDVSFEAALRDAVQPPAHATLQRTHARHLPIVARSVADVQGVLVASPSDNVGSDLNTVSMDQEMGRVTLNAFHYNTSIEFMGRALDQLRRVISEGGR